MGDTEPPNDMLHQAKYSSISRHSYTAGLDPVATSYLVTFIYTYIYMYIYIYVYIYIYMCIYNIYTYIIYIHIDR